MNNNLKVVIITGANSLIGKEIALRFLNSNWKVHGTLRSKIEHIDLIENENMFYHELDLLDTISIYNVFSEILNIEGRIDTLINNAGFVLSGAFETYTEEQIKRQMDVNFWGSVYCIKQVIPLMKKIKSGIIINISSLCGLVTFPMFSMYHASKWAIEGFSESIRYELDMFGIKIKLVEPGGVMDNNYKSTVEFGTINSEEYNEMLYKVHNTNWFPSFSNSNDVAQIVYNAVIDNTNRFRYIIGKESEMFINERTLGFDDESYILKIKKRIEN